MGVYIITYSIRGRNMAKKKKKKTLKQLGFKKKGPAIKKLTWGMTCYGLIPKDASSDEGVPSGAGSEFSVEKVPGGFEVT